MTPDQASAIHSAAFAPDRGWSADEIAALLDGPGVRLHSAGNGFALVRTVANETELLTLAVHPSAQRRGAGEALLTDWLNQCSAETAFLEVAEDNPAALRLYRRFGFTESGRRIGYYRRANAEAVDALLMRLELTRGQIAQTGGRDPKTG